MDTHTFYMRQMLMQYGRQLVSGRRIARYEQMIGRQQSAEDEVLLRRKNMVQRISREIMENLVFSGSSNPVVLEVRNKLKNLLNEDFVFQYPPSDLSLKIFRQKECGELIEVKEEEKKIILEKLWEVTVNTVNETML